MSHVSGVVPPTPYRIIDSLVVTSGGGIGDGGPNDLSEPFITDVTGTTAPGPALAQTDWGPNGPNAVLEFDEKRNNLISYIFKGHTFATAGKGMSNA